MCSIFFSLVPFLGGGLGIGFGIIGLRHCARSAERGRGLAIAGISIGAVSIVFWVITIIVITVAGHNSNSGSGLGALSR